MAWGARAALNQYVLEECSDLLADPAFHRAFMVHSIEPVIEEWGSSHRCRLTITLRSGQQREALFSLSASSSRVYLSAEGFKGHEAVLTEEPCDRRQQVHSAFVAASRSLALLIAQSSGNTEEEKLRATAISELAIPSALYPLDESPRWFQRFLRERIQNGVDSLRVRRAQKGWEDRRESVYRLCPPALPAIELYGGRLARARPMGLDPSQQGISGFSAFIPGLPGNLADIPTVLLSSNDAQRQRALIGSFVDLFLFLPDRFWNHRGAARRSSGEKLAFPHRRLRKARWWEDALAWGGGSTASAAARIATPEVSHANLGMEDSAWRAMQIEIFVRRLGSGWSTAISSAKNEPVAADSGRVRREAERLYGAYEPANSYLALARLADAVFRATHARQREVSREQRERLSSVDDDLHAIKARLDEHDLDTSASMAAATTASFWKRMRLRVMYQAIAMGVTAPPAWMLGHPEMALLGFGGFSVQFMMHALAGKHAQRRHPQVLAEQRQRFEKESAGLAQTRRDVLDDEEELAETHVTPRDVRPSAREYTQTAFFAMWGTGSATAATTAPFEVFHPLLVGIVVPAVLGPYTAEMEVWAREFLHDVKELHASTRDGRQTMYEAMDESVSSELLTELSDQIHNAQKQLLRSTTPPTRVQRSSQLSDIWEAVKAHHDAYPLRRFQGIVKQHRECSDTEILEALAPEQPDEAVADAFMERVQTEVREVAEANTMLRDLREYVPRQLRPEKLLDSSELLLPHSDEHRELADTVRQLPHLDGEGRLLSVAWEVMAETAERGEGGTLDVTSAAAQLHRIGEVLWEDCDAFPRKDSLLRSLTVQRDGPHQRFRRINRGNLAAYLQAALATSRDTDASLDAEHGSAREAYLFSVRERVARQPKLPSHTLSAIDLSPRVPYCRTRL